MSQTHLNHVNGTPNETNRHSSVPNGRPMHPEADSGNGLTITASLSESPRFMRRNLPADPNASVTRSLKPGDPPTTHSVLKQGNGELKVVETPPVTHVSMLQGSVNRQADLLGTITIGEAHDPHGGGVPFIPQHHDRPNPQPCTFQIFVNSFKNSRTYTFDVQKDYSVQRLMDMIFDKLDIPQDQQKLTFGCKNLLETTKTLGDYGIEELSTVFLTLRLRGG
ncbi:unnamed protein product [Lymnaea stagnalis]|uniref:Ubiquitin-like domain-containing protein n=1 Tax=Lymnaea stagnalis TaxID=6523 RepID=A0AAV2I831_LYMST